MTEEPTRPHRGTDAADQSSSKAARTRSRILDAAAHVLSVKGYAGMRLSDVAEVAEVQAPGIYYHFSSREELIEEVMRVGVAEMTKYVAAALEDAPEDAGPMERIMIAVEQHLRHELEISDYATASIRNLAHLPPGIRERPMKESARYGDLWRGLIHAAADAGEIRDDLDLHVAHMLVIGALNWAAEWWNPERGSLDKTVAVARSFVRAALSPHAD